MRAKSKVFEELYPYLVWEAGKAISRLELSAKVFSDDFLSSRRRAEKSFSLWCKLFGIGNSAFLLAAAFAYLFTRVLAPDSVESRR
ncbi:hypothetical protein TNCV_810801 [Trichonephila clavipes]|uniref:Uncharacterized protein n=1 Tax=Trichonephila clavipes TaxID=2585209 RepID=A0A8X6V8B2_TRICX|nr:hypothetical protein TNCV_810801 [Trichonephila clavipes]